MTSMLNWYRLTKYPPVPLGPGNDDRADDWTSFSDIGKEFGGERLTLAAYLQIENAYIDFYGALLASLAIRSLHIVGLEAYDTEGLKWAEKPLVTAEEYDHVIRAMLREQMWGKLVDPCVMEIHFGYDYYTYFGTQHPWDIALLGQHLYCDAIPISPYC